MPDQSTKNTQRRLHSSLPDPIKLNNVTNHHKLLCQSPQEPLPDGGVPSKMQYSWSKIRNLWGFSTDYFWYQNQAQGRKIQNGDTGNKKDLPPDRGVGHVHRFQGILHLYTHTKPIKKITVFSRPGLNIPVQSFTIWSVHSTHRVYSSCQRGQTDGFTHLGYKDPPVLRQLAVRVRSHQTCLQHTQSLVAICQGLGWLVKI